MVDAPLEPGQCSMFDLEELTVAAPDAAARAALVAKGDTAAGRAAIFAHSQIRQITLAYGWKEHATVVTRIEGVMARTKTKNASEAMLKLLDCWDYTVAQKDGKAA